MVALLVLCHDPKFRLLALHHRFSAGMWQCGACELGHRSEIGARSCRKRARAVPEGPSAQANADAQPVSIPDGRLPLHEQ